jgi:hypothetical protein
METPKMPGLKEVKQEEQSSEDEEEDEEEMHNDDMEQNGEENGQEDKHKPGTSDQGENHGVSRFWEENGYLLLTLGIGVGDTVDSLGKNWQRKLNYNR